MLSSTTKSLGDLLKLGRFEPAEIQREYQWETTHVEKLLNDLVACFQRMHLDPGESGPTETAEDEAAQSAADEDIKIAPSLVTRRHPQKRVAPDAYFLGTVILLQLKPDHSFAVYDGLQRLVTLAILLSVVRDTWKSTPESESADLHELLLDVGGKRRIEYVTTGRMLGSIVQGSKPERRSMSDGDFRIRDAAEFFRKQFDARWDNARRIAFLSFLRSAVQVTVTKTDNRAVAYQMFIGANSRGLRLGVGDVVKSLIAEQMRANGGTRHQVEACAKRWGQTQQRLQRDFDDFVHAVEVYHFLPDSSDATLLRNYDTPHTTGEKLQNLFDDATPPDEIFKWVEGDFAKMAGVFERARSHHRLDVADGADLSFRQLSFLEWKEWQPLLLSICLKYENLGSSQLAKEIHALKRACYIVELLDWSESTRRRKFMEAIEAREANKSPFARQGKGKPSALNFRPGGDALKSAQRTLRAPLTSKQKRGALVRYIETLHWKGRTPKSCTSDANVEHVLPITAFGEWSVAFNDDEREALTNRLGNLCILDRQANLNVGNKEWRYKSAEYLKWRTTFRGVEKVITKAQAIADSGNTFPWCPQAVTELTEELASLAEKSLLIA